MYWISPSHINNRVCLILLHSHIHTYLNQSSRCLPLLVLDPLSHGRSESARSGDLEREPAEPDLEGSALRSGARACCREGRPAFETGGLLCGLDDMLAVQCECLLSRVRARLRVCSLRFYPILPSLVCHCGPLHYTALSSLLSSVAVARCHLNALSIPVGDEGALFANMIPSALWLCPLSRLKWLIARASCVWPGVPTGSRAPCVCVFVLSRLRWLIVEEWRMHAGL